jgi:hypothetical protein
MIHKEVILRDVEIPDGYEPTGEYRSPVVNEPFLYDGNVISAHNHSTKRLILRKIPQWRDPVLPADAGKRARFSDEGSWWEDGECWGYWINDPVQRWLDNRGVRWKLCQVCDD